jgi:hypothetical protein
MMSWHIMNCRDDSYRIGRTRLTSNESDSPTPEQTCLPFPRQAFCMMCAFEQTSLEHNVGLFPARMMACRKSRQ